MVTRKQEEYRARYFKDMRDLQQALLTEWVDRSLPEGWHGLELEIEEPEQEEVAIDLDVEMVKWFKRLGPNWQKRMNMILRIYWRGLLTGDIRSHWAPEVYGPEEEGFLEALFERQLAEAEASGAGEEIMATLREALSRIRQVHEVDGSDLPNRG